MINAIASIVKGIFKPAADLVDNLHTSEEEKLLLRNELTQIESSIIGKVLETQQSMVTAQSQVLIAETKSDSFLTKNWRPLIMLMFGVMIGIDSIEVINFSLNQYAYEIVYLGIGGYVGGRSVEKVAKVVSVFKSTK